jgi:hypothetical protein
VAYDSESEDNDAAQDEAAAAAQASGIDMGGYDFGNPGKDDDKQAYRDALSRVSKDTYNVVNDITPTNPYGKKAWGYNLAKFLGNLGIGSGKVSFGPSQTNNAFTQADGLYGLFANPFNEQGKPGYRPDVPTSLDGMVRPGLQSGIFSSNAGQETALGTLADYDTNYSGMDNLALTAVSALAGLPAGLAVRALTGSKTGLVTDPTDPVSLMAGTPVGALMPTDEMAAQGQTYRGIGRTLSQGIGQFTSSLSDAMKTAKSLISDTKAKTATTPQKAQTNNLDLSGFEARFAPQAPSSFEGIMAPSSLESVLDAVQTAQAPQPSFGIAGNIQDYMPVEGYPEQEAVTQNPLGYQQEATLLAPTDMYGFLTGQLAQPATPFNIQSVGNQRDRKISPTGFLDAYSKKMGI